MSRLLHQLILHCITQLSSTMEDSKVEAPPKTLSPSSNGRTRRRRRSSGSSSFEFCVLRKPNLLSADQLFSDGVLLPLHLLHRPSSADDPPPEPKQPDSSSVVEQSDQPDPFIGVACVEEGGGGAFSSSKRWRDIFKRSDKKRENASEKVNNKDKKGGIFGGSNGASAAERVLNINIWPFRRTKSAGNTAARPVGSGLSSSPKATSAPCSGTNSPGEFKSKKSPSRSSLVWPARRSVGGRSYGFLTKPADKSPRKDGSYVERSFRKEGNKGWRKVSPAGGDWHKARILTMKDSMSTDASPAAAAAGGVSGEGPVRVNLRTLFTKKVY